jgi:hypothetical protein
MKTGKDIKLGILKSYCREYRQYVKSCGDMGIEYEVIDIISPDWIEKIENSNCDGFLCRPPSKIQEQKTMFDERLLILTEYMGRKIYPGYNELYIYENKRMMSYWLRVNGFPHTDTYVFYRKKDLSRFLDQHNEFPMIYKSNIGARSSGVKIVKSKKMARSIGRRIFGIYQSPSLTKGYTPVKSGSLIKVPAVGVSEKHVMLLQKFENIKWEWRLIKIGNSYFGHRKLLSGSFASGSGRVKWGAPPEKLLYMVKDICEKGSFVSMAVDIFETEDRRFLVNELQSIFGSYNDSQMYINGVPGRFVFKDGKFVFQEGKFNQYGSFKLRVEHFCKILAESSDA